MKQYTFITLIVLGTLAATGCATKKYVRNTVSPVQGQLNQVAQQTTQQGQTLEATNKSLDDTKQNLDQTKTSLGSLHSEVEKDETDINAANERAVSAGRQADEANKKAEQVGRDVGDLRNDLRNVVANLDEYKQVANTTVNFAFNSDKLAPGAKQELDQMVQNQGQYKRYFIAVEGFTDSTGSVEYNQALSRRRADAVVEYLVGEHNVPVYRIHMVGLGKMKPIEDAHTRAANAKNRRVEVMLFSADQALATGGQTASVR